MQSVAPVRKWSQKTLIDRLQSAALVEATDVSFKSSKPEVTSIGPRQLKPSRLLSKMRYTKKCVAQNSSSKAVMELY